MSDIVQAAIILAVQNDTIMIHADRVKLCRKALEESEERGRRKENEAWKKAAGECKRGIGDILLAIRARVEAK